MVGTRMLQPYGTHTWTTPGNRTHTTIPAHYPD
jgi:hypothetical protein